MMFKDQNILLPYKKQSSEVCSFSIISAFLSIFTIYWLRPLICLLFQISTVPTKTKLRESAYSEAPIQNKIDRPDPESQAGRQSEGYGGWCSELRQGGRNIVNARNIA